MPEATFTRFKTKANQYLAANYGSVELVVEIIIRRRSGNGRIQLYAQPIGGQPDDGTVFHVQPHWTGPVHVTYILQTGHGVHLFIPQDGTPAGSDEVIVRVRTYLQQS